MAESATSKRKIVGRERTIRCLELRKAGATFQQIGDELGITRQGAHKAAKRGMQELINKTPETAAETRAVQLLRIDALLLGVWDRARKGDDAAIDRVLRLEEFRAKLTGTFAPKLQELTGQDGGPIDTSVTVRYVGIDDEERSEGS